LEQLNLLALKNKLIDELSDGQRQKVMIAKSLAQQTPMIVLDEPTAFLDYNSKHHLFSILKKLCVEQGKLIIVSSHDIDLMQKYITRSVKMSEGSQFVTNTV
jgi:iron complex transport system ATP-binding protein